LDIKELKKEFTNNLAGRYPPEELQSFFNILSEKHLGLSRIEIALHPTLKVSKQNSEKFKEAYQRLKQFEPIQYIVGATEFYGLPFLVNKNVLIPRPETEELVAWIVAENKGRALEVLDIGTGSGCIAIALAHKLPEASVSGIDISKKALRVANQNALNNKVSVNFKKHDVLNLKKEHLNTTFNIIVSNPPYVREQEKSQLEPNVIKHEPSLALFVKDEDPLLFYRKIAQLSKKYLKPTGSLYFEINEYLSKELITMLKKEGFNKVLLRNDIFGKPRMLKCEI